MLSSGPIGLAVGPSSKVVVGLGWVLGGVGVWRILKVLISTDTHTQEGLYFY